ncbi:hypothetical protein [Piscinibacter sp.]|uniref:hypothetical protein n=1 Tax=Piscinibacter sp. TaxID=1903157 RepID=UPI002B532C50|nr:hypothetical protein [Albitalea sp.]HUG22914.1 hypothetical protein [Albitalea sp.]
MTPNWFFATTPAPRSAVPVRRQVDQPHAAWWHRLGTRLIAWGEQAGHHRIGSWTRR